MKPYEAKPLKRLIEPREIKPSLPAPPKSRAVSGHVRKAADLLADGSVRTIKEAAELIGISREHLSRLMNRQESIDFFKNHAVRRLRGALPRAAAVLADLLDTDSDRVRFDSAVEVLGQAGLRSKDGSSTNINVAVSHSAGYVINLSPDRGPPVPGSANQPVPLKRTPVIDLTAEPVELAGDVELERLIKSLG